MKKYLFSIVVAGLSAVVFLTMICVNNVKNEDDLFIANVEALSQIETLPSGSLVKCFETVVDDFYEEPIWTIAVYKCENCQIYHAHEANTPSTCKVK